MHFFPLFDRWNGVDQKRGKKRVAKKKTFYVVCKLIHGRSWLVIYRLAFHDLFFKSAKKSKGLREM